MKYLFMAATIACFINAFLNEFALEYTVLGYACILIVDNYSLSEKLEQIQETLSKFSNN